MLRPKDNRIFKEDRVKLLITHKRKPMELMADHATATTKLRRQSKDIA